MQYYHFINRDTVLLLLGLAITLFAQYRMRATYKKYSEDQAQCGITGADAARKILAANGVYGVTVRPIQGNLTDNYDPRDKTLNLSADVFGGTSVNSICVAAHECGHAIQDSEEYPPLKLRGAMVPIANFGSRAAWLFIFLGVVIAGTGSSLVEIGIVLFSLAVVLELLTLPVEFDASKRAMMQLDALGILSEDEQKRGRKVLNAAAFTYVASAATGALQLLRLILLYGRKDEN